MGNMTLWCQRWASVARNKNVRCDISWHFWIPKIGPNKEEYGKFGTNGQIYVNYISQYLLIEMYVQQIIFRQNSEDILF